MRKKRHFNKKKVRVLLLSVLLLAAMAFSSIPSFAGGDDAGEETALLTEGDAAADEAEAPAAEEPDPAPETSAAEEPALQEKQETPSAPETPAQEPDASETGAPAQNSPAADGEAASESQEAASSGDAAGSDISCNGEGADAPENTAGSTDGPDGEIEADGLDECPEETDSPEDALIGDPTAADALAEEIGAAPADGSAQTITIAEDVSLSAAITLKKGQNIILTSSSAQTVSADASSWKGQALFVVPEGAKLTISGALTLDGSKKTRVIRINSGGEAVIAGGTIQNGTQSAVYNYGTLTVNGGTLQNNTSGSGGAVYSAGTLTINGGTFSGNKADSFGAAVYSSGDLVINGGEFSGNIGERGAATSTWVGGGGGAVASTGNLTINNGTFINNQTTSMGGAIYISISSDNKTAVINNCYIAGNRTSSRGAGGGIYIASHGSSGTHMAYVLGGIIENNGGSSMGGGVYVGRPDDAAYFGHAVVYGNSASSLGGGIWMCSTASTTFELNNSMAVFGNTASGAGDDLAINGRPSIYPVIIAKRMLGGGRNLYYVDGALASVASINDNAGPVWGAVRYEPGHGTPEFDYNTAKGFVLHNACSDAAKAAALGSAALIIRNNSARYGGGIGSNGQVYSGTASASTEVAVRKLWTDDTEEFPDAVTVTLSRNGVPVEEKTLTAPDWETVFDALPVSDESGADYTYTVTEKELPGYELVSQETTEEDEKQIVTITNAQIVETPPETTEISVRKIWDDLDDGEGFRPESITVTLYADGEEAAVQTITAEDNWEFVFRELPKIRETDGGEIVYTVSEEPVEAYKTSISGSAAEGFVITNTLTETRGDVETKSLTVTKVWDDADDQDGIRPARITVTLFEEGEELDSVELSAENNWTHTFEYLNADLTYTVEEKNVPSGYAVQITGSAEEGYVITNTHTPKEPEPTVTPTPEPSSGTKTGTGKTTASATPKTGDSQEPVRWLMLLIGAAVLVTIFAVDKKRSGI